jgi:hypothetical protein
MARLEAGSKSMNAATKTGPTQQCLTVPTGGVAAIAAVICALATLPAYAQAQSSVPTPSPMPVGHVSLPPVAWIAIGGFVLIVFALIGFVVAIWRKEAANRRPAPTKKRRSSHKPDNPAWRETGKGRRSRDPTDVRVQDDDLPPITVMTGAAWANKDQAVPRQSSLIATTAAPVDDSSNVYKTGYNPFFRHSDAEQIQVEEVADLVEQAELMNTLANYPAAISMLTRHIRDTETPSPKAWLMLFDLYIKTEREDQYTNLAKGFRIQFNADVPSWSQQKTEPVRNLEDYPRVMDRICGAWGGKDIKPLLNSLLFDDRGGSRAGFKLEAYADLLLLLDIVEALVNIEVEIADRREIERKLQSKPLV